MYFVFSRKISKKRKYGGLPNIAHTGHLRRKSLFGGFETRACVVQDRRLLIFKSDSSKKWQDAIDLDVYAAVYAEKDGKHQHVIRLRKAGGGGSEHLFLADSHDDAKNWLKVSHFSCILYNVVIKNGNFLFECFQAFQWY